MVDRLNTRRLTRKEILLGGVSAASAVILTACGVPPEPHPESEVRIPPEVTPTSLQLETRLHSTIEGLPHSQYKMVAQKALDIFSTPRPKSVSFSSLTIPVAGAEITYRAKQAEPNQPISVLGSYGIRGDISNQPVYYPVQKQIFAIPLVGMFYPGERIANAVRSADGTILAVVIYSPQQPMLSALAPRISLTSYRGLTDPEVRGAVETVENFLLLKEAINLGMEFLWIEEVVNKMRQDGKRLEMVVRPPNGQPRNIEAISHSISDTTGHGGRTAALLDIASTLVMIKATESVVMPNYLMDDLKLRQLIIQLRGVSFGNTPREVLLNSLKYALELPADMRPVYSGVIAKIP